MTMTLLAGNRAEARSKRERERAASTSSIVGMRRRFVTARFIDQWASVGIYR